MQRRKFITALGAASVLGGCSSLTGTAEQTSSASNSETRETVVSGGEGTPARTRTSPEETPVGVTEKGTVGEPSPTVASTPGTAKARGPELQSVAPITRPDIATEARHTTAFGRGAPVIIAATVELPVQDGEVDYTITTEAGRRGGVIVGRDDQLGTAVQTRSGRVTRKVWQTLPADAFVIATYTAAVTIDDTVTGESASDSVDFDVTRPLNQSEVNLVDTNIPSKVTVGESFDYELTLENTSDRDSSLVSDMSYTRDGVTGFTRTDGELIANLAAGSQYTVKVRDAEAEQAGEYTMRLDAVDETFPLTIS